MKNKEIVIDTRLNTILFDNTKYYDVPKEILSYIEQLENNRDKAIEILGQYKHYSTPTEEQNSENEDIVDNALIFTYIQNLEKKVELGDHYKHLYSEVKKQKDDVVEYIKNNFIEGEVFYSKVWLKKKKDDLLRMLGEVDE